MQQKTRAVDPPLNNTSVQNTTKNYNQSPSPEQYWCSKYWNRSNSKEQQYCSTPLQKLEPLNIPGATVLFKTLSTNGGTAPPPRSNSTIQNPTQIGNRSTSHEQHCCFEPHQNQEPLHLPGAPLLFKTPPQMETAPPPRSNSTIQTIPKT